MTGRTEGPIVSSMGRPPTCAKQNSDQSEVLGRAVAAFETDVGTPGRPGGLQIHEEHRVELHPPPRLHATRSRH
jgi:hypothetical protein